MRTNRNIPIGLAVLLFAGMSARAGIVTLTALDTGFVTEAGGSAKGDGPVAKFNYSVGYEVHYSMGFPSTLAPMMRKNYFVFDFSSVTDPIVGATLTLYTGVLESPHTFETFVLKETPAQPGAMADATTLATLPYPTAFDGPGDPGIAAALGLYSKIGAGPGILATYDVSHGEDASTISITFTPDGVSHLNGLAISGGPHLLGGLVTSVDFGAGTPQQPFGFTGPDIPGGDPLTPKLVLTTVPEPTSLTLVVVGGLLVARRRFFGLANQLARGALLKWNGEGEIRTRERI